MSLLRTLGSATLLSALTVACATADDLTSESAGELTSHAPLSIVTYNMGLVRGAVALADERLPLIAPALQETGADVFCVDELWTDEDYERIRGSLASTHPNAFRQRTVKDGTHWFECNPLKLLSLNQCVSGECTPNGVSAEQCVQTACKDAYAALSDDCKICLTANTDSPARCLFRSNDFVQGGRNGLALFSKHPIENATFEPYGTAVVHRGMIRATIQGKSISCTHLSADLTTVPYPKGQRFRSWKEEQLAQADILLARSQASGCRIITGDLNASHERGSLKAEVPETLVKLEAGGFTENWPDASCSWCAPPSNPLTSGTADKLLDHVYVAGCGSNVTYRRVMDQPVRVVHDGQELTTRLSDHYGVMAVIGAR